MAVEIKELIIRAVAVEETAQTLDTVHHSQVSQMMSPEVTDQIVQACVREVLKVIERKSSR